MAASASDIANRALAHLGAHGSISDIESDTSEAAITMLMFYEQALKVVYRSMGWGFPTKMADLALVEEEPNDEWLYSYRYPSDCLFLKRVCSGVRQDTNDTLVPYKISHDATGKVIWTDDAEAQVEYVAYLSTTTMFPDDFAEAVEWYLAFLAAPKLTNGDTAGMGMRAFQMFKLKIGEASARSRNEDQRDRPPESEFIRCRG